MWTWKAICDSPTLQDLPFKIETNQQGQIIMTPTYNWHGHYQVKISDLLEKLMETPGQRLVECSVRTTQGTKVADVAWCSLDRWEIIKDECESSVAPQLCVEVMSRSNTEEEMRIKRGLYFAAGAEEVWLCDATGAMRFFDPTGERPASALAPQFPKRIA